MEAPAQYIRDAGHQAFCPTLAGNRSGDVRRTTTLEEAIQSLFNFIEDKDLTNIRLAGHSYGAWVTAFIFYKAFVPEHGESLLDLVSPPYAELFTALASNKTSRWWTSGFRYSGKAL